MKHAADFGLPKSGVFCGNVETGWIASERFNARRTPVATPVATVAAVATAGATAASESALATPMAACPLADDAGFRSTMRRTLGEGLQRTKLRRHGREQPQTPRNRECVVSYGAMHTNGVSWLGVTFMRLRRDVCAQSASVVEH